MWCITFQDCKETHLQGYRSDHQLKNNTWVRHYPTIAPGGTTAPGAITIALGGATTAPGGANTALAGSTKDATQHHPPGDRTTPAPGPGHRQGTMTEGDQNPQNPTGRDKEAKGQKPPEEMTGTNPDQAHDKGTATTPGDNPLPREEQTAEMTGEGTAQRPERTEAEPAAPLESPGATNANTDHMTIENWRRQSHYSYPEEGQDRRTINVYQRKRMSLLEQKPQYISTKTYPPGGTISKPPNLP